MAKMICIDPGDGNDITLGEIYLCQDSDESNYYKVVTDSGHSRDVYKRRFEPVLQKIRCIDATNCYLSKDEIYYTVNPDPGESTSSAYYTVFNNKGLKSSYFHNRFVVVEDFTTKTVGKTATNDSEKHAQFLFFRTSAHAENCKSCGAPRPCRFHS